MHVRAIIVVSALGSLTLASCGSSSPAEVIVKPGITAIEQSGGLVCDADLRALETSIENYTLLNAGPPTAESDLVPDWLRSESQLYDIVDGAIVPAAGSGCPATSAGAEIAAPATTVDDRLVRTCSIQYKTLRVAIEAYYAMNGTGTVPTEQALVDAGLLIEPDLLYDVDVSGNVVVAANAVCDGIEVVEDTTTPLPDPGPAPAPVNLEECYEERRALEVTMEVYLETNGSSAADESVLVSAELLYRDLAGYDVVDGMIVPAPGSICPPV